MTFKVKDGISIAGTTFVDGSRNITIGTLNGNTPIHSGNYSSYAAPSSHTHDYLPLSGGTIAGQLNVNNAGSATTVMRLWSAGSSIWSLGVGDSSGTNFNISSDFGSFLINKSSGNVTTSGQYYAGSSNLVLHLGNKDNYTYPPASHDHSRIGWTGARTAESGTTNSTPSGFFEMVGAYNNGWPATYGNVLSANGGGAGQLYMGWIGGSGAETGELYYRSMTDWRTNWGSWRRIITDANYNSYALPLSGGTVSGTVTANYFQGGGWGVHLNPSTAAIRGNGGYGGALALVDGSYGIALWSQSGTLHFGLGSNTAVTAKATMDTNGNFNVAGALTQASNQVLHAGNYTNYPSQRIVSGYQEWNFSWGSHGTTPMSISLWDNYDQSGAPSGFGTLLDVYGLSGHQHDQLYFHQGNLIHRYGWYGNNNWSGWQTILTSSNYNSYAPTLTGGGASGSWNIAAVSIGIPNQQVERTILDGPANGPVIKVRYDGATANRYIDIGSKDGNGVYYEGLKIYNGSTPTWGGNALLHAGNLSTSATANTVAYRDANGDIAAREIVLSSALQSSTPTVLVAMFPTTNQLVRMTPGAVAASMGALTTGNYSSYSLPLSGGTLTGNTQLYANDGGNSPRLIFGPEAGSPYSYKAIYTDAYWLTFQGHVNEGMRFRLVNGSGITTYSTLNTSYLDHGVSMRAPIFYDIDDTGYYINPNSTSDAALRIRGGALHGPNPTWGAYLLVGGDGRQNYTDSGYASVCTTNGNLHLDSGSGYSTHINWYDGTDLVVGAGNSSSTRFRIYGSDNYTFASGSMRSPVFYDSDDTGYYCNPNSFSQLSYANLNAAPGGRTLSLGGDETNRIYADAARASLVINATQYPHLYLNATTNISNTAHGAVFSMTGNLSGGGYRRWGMGIANTDPDCWSWGWWDNSTNPHYSVGGGFGYTDTGSKMWLNTAGSLMASGDMRSPAFYDSNNTGYYVDPSTTGTSVNVAGSVRGSYYVASNYLSTGYTQYKGYDNNNHFIVVRGDVGGNTSSPSITGMHRTTFVEYAEANDSSGWFFRTSGTGNYDIISRITRSYSHFNSSVRSPLFYDSDDTGYYVNPADGGFNLRGGTSNRVTYVTNDSGFKVTNAEGNGISDVRLGAAWGAPGVYCNSTLYLMGETAVYWKINNADKGYMDTNANLFAFSSMRSPTFYDSNDTAYYIDPSDSSRLNGTVTVAGGHGDSSLRVLLNANENGANTGEARLQLWCSEPGNSWDWGGFGYNVDHNNNTNPPAYYFGRPNTNFGQAYMRMSPAGNWYFYNTNTGGTRYETMVLTNSGTVEISNSVRSAIFYDLNNTAYFADLNSTGDSIRAAGNITAYYSDMRLKTHLGKIENALDKVRQLEGFYYEANETAQKLGYKPKREVGVSAQDVQVVLPEIVTDAPINSNYLTIDYERLTPLLIEAMKEQDQEVVDLKLQLQKQQSEIDTLKALVQQLLAK